MFAEKIQRRAARFVRNAQGTMLYKIVHHLAKIPEDHILISADNETLSNHRYEFKNIQSNLTVYKNTPWNNLGVIIAESSNLENLKTRLKPPRQ